MKTVILAGGLGTRLQEETAVKPKPMVEIGEHPILWHIMKIYSWYGFNEFVIGLGYKGEIIKDYFINYCHRQTNLKINICTGEIEKLRISDLEPSIDNWTVHLLDTGLNTQTGGRVKRLMEYIGDKPIMLTYGDGVANIDIQKLLQFHKSHGKIATITAVRPPARFGRMIINNDKSVTDFEEKPQMDEGWINGGFFVFNPEIIKYIDGDTTLLEREPLDNLAYDNQLMAYIHEGFWHCMDTMRDVKYLNELWNSRSPAWKVW